MPPRHCFRDDDDAEGTDGIGGESSDIISSGGDGSNAFGAKYEVMERDDDFADKDRTCVAVLMRYTICFSYRK
jgi:hypothetical protein